MRQARNYPDDPEEFKGMSDRFINYPVVRVNWNNVVAYCDWSGLRLPTEAQWEKGARGTDARKYPWGNSEPDTNKANYNESVGYTSPVGNYPSGASPYGLMDIAGNALEWCNDWYGEDYYSKSPKSNPKGPSSDIFRVLRGSPWYDNDVGIRCAFRRFAIPTHFWFDVGFRPAVS